MRPANGDYRIDQPTSFDVTIVYYGEIIMKTITHLIARTCSGEMNRILHFKRVMIRLNVWCVCKWVQQQLRNNLSLVSTRSITVYLNEVEPAIYESQLYRDISNKGKN